MVKSQTKRIQLLHIFYANVHSMFVMPKNWKTTKCPLTDCLNRFSTVHVDIGILLGHKNNKILPYATA